jgi:regulator of protease activity HflC (stomatin/prohibitin superfamily)
MDVPSQEVVTKNDAIVQVNGVVLCQIILASLAAYEVNNL